MDIVLIQNSTQGQGTCPLSRAGGQNWNVDHSTWNDWHANTPVAQAVRGPMRDEIPELGSATIQTLMTGVEVFHTAISPVD